ncbi:MAG: 50S ribosomal protein L13 [Candidatus Peribacteraceae bacterium]|nr:50S ribosomal protein L13 [Candidatus Peribacteraceae bacterium]
MKTSIIPPQAPIWHIVDADGKSVGRMATIIANTLRGKGKASFSPHQLCGDHVIVINAAKLYFPQKKLLQKEYHSHTGFIGHLRSRTLEKMMEKSPEKVVELAVKRMLPSNRLRPQWLKQLHIYNDENHKHEAQMPIPLDIKSESTS